VVPTVEFEVDFIVVINVVFSRGKKSTGIPPDLGTLCGVTRESRKGSKNRAKIWPLPRFKNFQRHECFDDSRFCLIFSFGGNYEILVETISVETILVETNIFWWKLLLFGGN
jgi:hypothetical protein